jgi:hypothetical protein
MSKIPRSERLGVPQNALFLSLLYSLPARTLVVHAQVAADPFRISRLFGKSLDAHSYEQLASVSDTESIEDPVVCPVNPVLYFRLLFLEMKRGRFAVMRDGQAPEWKDGETAGGWIKGIYRKNLVTGFVTPIIEYEIRKRSAVWVSSLHSVAPDGKTIFCSAAFAEWSSASAGDSAYHLCQLDVGTGALTKVAPLMATFF